MIRPWSGPSWGPRSGPSQYKYVVLPVYYRGFHNFQMKVRQYWGRLIFIMGNMERWSLYWNWVCRPSCGPLWHVYWGDISALCLQIPWWHHQMETFPMSLALCEGNPPVTKFPSQRPVTRCFDGFFDKRLNKQTVVQAIKAPVIWDAIALIMTSL